MLEIVQYPRRWARATKRRVDEETEGRSDRIGLHVLLFVSVFLVVFPVIVGAIVSTKQQGIITNLGDLVPGGYALQNYRRAMVDFNFGRFLWNSFLMSIVIVVGKLVLSVAAAMAIVYYRVPYKDLVFLFILFTLMLPVPVRFVPLFRLMNTLGWGNTIWAITIPYLASATTVFILRQHFLSISGSIVETAKLDGVGPIKFLVYVLVPMSRGVLVGVAIIMFIFAWNQFLWPLVIIDSEANQVAQVGLSLLQGDVQSGDVAWAMIMTGSMLTLLPPLVLLLVFRKPLLETFAIQEK